MQLWVELGTYEIAFSVVDCSNLTSPSNGHVSVSTTTFGSMATYTCEEGYMLMGFPMRECLSNGSWSQQEPVCESKSSNIKFFTSVMKLSFLFSCQLWLPLKSHQWIGDVQHVHLWSHGNLHVWWRIQPHGQQHSTVPGQWLMGRSGPHLSKWVQFFVALAWTWNYRPHIS